MNYGMLRWSLVPVFCGGLAVLLAAPGEAADNRAQHAALCDLAISAAASEFDVPVSVLKAISRVETGVTLTGSFVAWPWTVNVAGEGFRFRSKNDALTYFFERYSAGERNIDLGCFQINHKWHRSRFQSVEDMIDPATNARYAAEFLSDLHGEFGDWLTAAGAYHSRSEEKAEKYLTRLMPILDRFMGKSRPSVKRYAELKKTNRFPLLRGLSRSQTTGSLFPQLPASRGGLFQIPDTQG